MNDQRRALGAGVLEVIIFSLVIYIFKWIEKICFLPYFPTPATHQKKKKTPTLSFTETAQKIKRFRRPDIRVG